MDRTPTLRYALGWRKDRLDHRDLKFSASLSVVKALPQHVDLTSGMPGIYDQGQAGSCTGNGWAAVFDFERKRQGLSFMAPSRLFIYYNERAIEGTTGQDAGAEIRDGATALAKQGVCSEAEWPYDIGKLTTKPIGADYAAALNNMLLQYQAVQQTADQIMGCLAEGFPIVFGFQVFAGYEKAPASGIIPLPRSREKPLGGHCNVLCGYDDSRIQSSETLVLSRNSWGTGWGQAGYCWFPMSYLTNQQLSADLWMAQLVSGPTPPPTPTPTPTPTPADTFNVGQGVRDALKTAGLTPASDEQTLNINKSNGWTSLTAASDGSMWAWVPSLGRATRL